MAKALERSRLFQILVLLAVFSIFLTNVLFIMKTSYYTCGRKVFGFPEDRISHLELNDNEKTTIKPDKKENDDTVRNIEKLLNIEVYSSKSNATITVNGKKLFNGDSPRYIGINVVVLNQETGAKMASRAFDTYLMEKESMLLQNFVTDITVGRIICFAVKDEASERFKKSVRAFFKNLGSAFAYRLGFRDMWAFVVQKRVDGSSRVLGEAFQRCKSCSMSSRWASPVDLRVTFVAEKSTDVCPFKDTPSDKRRRAFCRMFEGYPGVCTCTNPINFNMSTPVFQDGSRFNVPISIMAGNRPNYLFRMLTTLKNVIGLDVSMVTVYIDGFFEETRAVADLFNLRVVQHEASGIHAGRIAQHYKKSLSKSFARHPNADYLLILEEDLAVSADILSYFKQLVPLLDQDPSLFCISAWNDQGYDHVVNDPAMLYRIETMPGLGWVLSRKIYKDELEPKWPGPDWVFDWDMWVRTPENIKGRECIIPDISRTFHFGTKGVNVNPFMQEEYFDCHAINKVPYVNLQPSLMLKNNYEKEIQRLIRSASLVDHSKTPCTDYKNFIPSTKNKTYVFYITMSHQNDYKTWMNIARCFKIWDIDARGYHYGLYRLWYKKNQILVIGCPYSKYCTSKPENLVPIDIQNRPRRPSLAEITNS